ncbi:hypothetical protein A5757_01470 [Mycobacterium sp. 852013-51886_SCH5428379]|nr:hypothetical protein A5757_01470 [Mycobacterium sp. 852013-51886_SCH5428379]
MHVYFSSEPLPRDIRPEELQRLNEFKAQLRTEGLLGDYSGVEDLQFKVRDAIEHNLKRMDLGKVVIRSTRADQARKVMNYRTSVSILGQGVWRVKTHNHSAGPVSHLNVRVSAVDGNGNVIANSIQRTKEVLSNQEVFARLLGDAFSGSLRPIIGPGFASMASRSLTPTVQPQFQDVFVAHAADGFPSGLAPDESAVALYVLPPGAEPVVVIEFRDEAGTSWSRTNDGEPERLDRA